MKKNSQKFLSGLAGFTLIELLIYVAILSVMSVVVADTFLTLNKGRGNIEAKSEVNSNFNFAIEKIKRDLTVSGALNFPAVAGASAPTLDLTIAGDNVKYAVLDYRLTRQVNAQLPEPLTSDKVKITDLNFLRLENVNAVLNKKRVSVEISIAGAYNSASPDWQYAQDQKTTVDLSPDF